VHPLKARVVETAVEPPADTANNGVVAGLGVEAVQFALDAFSEYFTLPVPWVA
jgi:phage terminase large subunit-like protein